MDSKLREKIIEILTEERKFTPIVSTERIMKLLAPELEKAAKYDKIKAIIDPRLLRTLANWIDLKYPNDIEPEVQEDLRAWADALEGEKEEQNV